MHLSLKDGSIEHRHFTDVLDYMEEGDCLVINDTKVIPARLYGHKEETGALIEILLLKRRENDIWECLVKPGKKARPGAKITFGNGILKGEIIDVVDEGNRLIQFHYEGIFEEILDQLGQMPLPPYITHQLKDSYDYTFADQRRHFEPVFIFHQNLVFPFETANDTSTGAVQETHFVSYFYVTHNAIYFCYLPQK